jgi:branched-chain amino acid transport system ATP-binding protein
MAFLEIRNLSSGYGEVQILWDVSLELERGKLTSLVGSNGVGKTTLLRTVMGQVRPWHGSVAFDDRDVTRVSPHVKAARGLILVLLPPVPGCTSSATWSGCTNCSRA